MAGDWIQIEHVTPDKPEVMTMAAALGTTENEVLGGLVRFWTWCDTQSRDGHAIGVTEKGMDRITCVTGMYDAMVEVGWLIVDEDGIHVPNYDYHLSQNAKLRALAARRQRRRRHDLVTQTSRNERDISVTREEKRREEKNKRNPHTPFSETFIRFWATYPRGRKTGKQATWSAWQAAIKRGADPEAIIKASENYAASELGKSEFVKGPAAWLRAGMYEDDPTEWRIANGKPKIRITQI